MYVSTDTAKKKLWRPKVGHRPNFSTKKYLGGAADEEVYIVTRAVCQNYIFQNQFEVAPFPME